MQRGDLFCWGEDCEGNLVLQDFDEVGMKMVEVAVGGEEAGTEEFGGGGDPDVVFAHNDGGAFAVSVMGWVTGVSLYCSISFDNFFRRDFYGSNFTK